MSLEQYTSHPYTKWMENGAPGQDVVLSSRIRLARNLDKIPFPHLTSTEQDQKVIAIVEAAVGRLDQQLGNPNWEMLRLDRASAVTRYVLVEKHLISPQLARAEGPVAVILRSDEGVSIMVNEEDHLRIQVLAPGLQLNEAWQLANRTDDVIESVVDYAYGVEQGFLTACPTNVGTGLRASVMMHLPALVMTHKIDKVLNAISQVGLVARGIYGEGTQALGNIFQISNQITLGQNEKEIIENITAVTKQIIEQERASRRTLQNEAALSLADRVGRACGILANARQVSSQEAMQLLSDIRLGVSLQMLRGLDHQTVNEMTVMVQPAWLNQSAGQELDSIGRDAIRANVLREQMREARCQ